MFRFVNMKGKADDMHEETENVNRGVETLRENHSKCYK